MDLDSTIAALASAPGSAWRGVIRIAGPDAASVVESAFEPDDASRAERGRFRRGAARRLAGRWRLLDSPVRLPCDLMLWPTTRSYTGQPTAELHLPGSPPLLEKVLEDLYRRGARPARPGEFTLRAFLAGKLDLLQAEAVLGVIDAHDDVELRTALSQLAGGISGPLAQLRLDLLDLLADLEAGLDFVEEDIEFVTRGEIVARVAVARRFVEQLIAQADSRMTSTPRPTVVLAGLPNAGKSALFNALAGRPAALVSPLEGTTRDYLRETIEGHGVRFELVDTAGWEMGAAGVAAAAQAQRRSQFEQASLIVWCSACDADEARRRADDDALAQAPAAPSLVLRVRTKCDVLSSPSGGRNPLPDLLHDSLDAFAPGSLVSPSGEIMVSAHSGIGLDDLLDEIARRLGSPSPRAAPWLGMTAARCRESLLQAAAALNRAEESAGLSAAGDELLAIDLRDALDHLGQIVGAVYTDDLLDRIFSKFCIGK